AHQAAARPRARRSGARELRQRARAARWHHGATARCRSSRSGGDPLARDDSRTSFEHDLFFDLPMPVAAYAASATALPLNERPCLPAETRTDSPSLMLLARIISASGSCRYFWMTRLSGRAP